MLLLSMLTVTLDATDGHAIALNPDFSVTDPSHKLPQGYLLTGAARYEYAGYKDEYSTKGVVLDSSQPNGAVSQTLDIDRTKGKWISFRVRARAEDGFAVANDQLYLELDFYGNHGQSYQDKVKRLIYRQITKDRRDFAVNGDDHKNGAAVWRTYQIEELLPFAQTDRIKLTLGFEGGVGKDKPFCRLMVDAFDIEQNQQSSDGRQDPADRITHPTAVGQTDGMIALGGRWFYRPSPDEHLETGVGGKLKQTLWVTEEHSKQLFYKDDRLENPFAGNMTAWLRKGFLDEDGKTVTQDRFVPDNVTLEFDGSPYFTIHARNIPNHPTARFPDTYGTQGYNPNSIQAHNYSWKLPLVPTLKKNPVAVDKLNTGMALPMGAVGVAINGVVFYNPFDAGMQDATGIMDRCCGHPSPDNRYHYHKYPICVNTPFVDKGETHSPIVGFAFDGLPIYGPYESADVMAKDSKDHPLNAFNAHYDAARGWHYHVTPGKFPYVIGGFFADQTARDRLGP